MDLDALVTMARGHGASDLHLEPGLPAALRIRGVLRTMGEAVEAAAIANMAQNLLGPEHWPGFLARHSADISRTIAGVRCRINVLQSSRGVGFAIRLLANFQTTLDKLNLHPDLKRFVGQAHGLILVSGPTGSGKSSTLAALVQEINLAETRHILTIESPIEYAFRPRQSYIRQREVGRDTPSFEQALIDALREDPDVLMVGEMREPETMRLTLNASETGHLVLATVHSSSCVEALQRIVSAFPAEVQSAVRAQLADCLVAVICQRLRYRADLKIRIPECEIVTSTMAVKNFIRTGEFYKIITLMETGADHGMWTWQRYQGWLESKKSWHLPDADEVAESEAEIPGAKPVIIPPKIPKMPVNEAQPAVPARPATKHSGPIEIEPVEGGLNEVLKQFQKE